ncbi:MAG: oxygen-independent coproporphyrinogen III oxidase [Xanthobacteraceae bacterium]|nr:oxygen-independent coproporphyrinogen III oxidase [Xanthobacteraceae bacterium]
MTIATTTEAVRRYARLQVPRYTSYPTAAEFSPNLSEADHRRLLQALAPSEVISLYVHVPYCRDICFYCGCHSKKAIRDDVVEDYRAALEREIGLVGSTIGKPISAARLHWGGGTPSVLGASGLASVIDALRQCFTFEADFEHAIELDPRLVTPSLASALAELRVNRVSLGVQDVNPAVQAAIGRLQPLQVVEAAVERLRAVGIDDINFDLIYGLPLQTVASLRKTCATVAALGPDRIAYYGYAHIPERKANQRQIDPSTLPGADERFEQAEVIASEFRARGYVRIGIDHFARPDDRLARAAAAGRLHRNFQGYTDDDRSVLVGFGSSAISEFPDGYVQNVPDVPRYIKAIGEGLLATARGCRVDADAHRRARIIESLLCQFRADLTQLAPGADFGEEIDMLAPFVAEGLVSVGDGVVAISDAGRTVARVIASVFDVFYRQRTGRFSVAV